MHSVHHGGSSGLSILKGSDWGLICNSVRGPDLQRGNDADFVLFLLIFVHIFLPKP